MLNALLEWHQDHFSLSLSMCCYLQFYSDTHYWYFMQQASNANSVNHTLPLR